MDPQPEPEPPRYVMCMDCGRWKLLQKGNHHPWCVCGSDIFDWARELDYDPEGD